MPIESVGQPDESLCLSHMGSVDLPDRSLPIWEARWPVPSMTVPLLAGRLLSQYRVHDGHARIAGFSKTPHVMWVMLSGSPDSEFQVLALFTDDHSPIRGPLLDLIRAGITRLRDLLAEGLATMPPMTSTSSFEPAPTRSSVASGGDPSRTLIDALNAWHPNRPSWWESLNWVLVLPTEWLEVKLCFEVGEHAVACEFGQWAPVLWRNPGLAPPYCCPHSGLSGRELAADDAGDISLISQRQSCQLSGRRYHDYKLVTCAHSGLRLCRSLAVASATTDHWFSPNHTSACRQCGLAAPRWTQRFGRCSACRNLQSINDLDSAKQLEYRWLLSPAIRPLGYAYEDLCRVQVYVNDRFSWFAYHVGGHEHRMVFAAERLVSHRLRRRWTWRWQDFDPS